MRAVPEVKCNMPGCDYREPFPEAEDCPKCRGLGFAAAPAPVGDGLVERLRADKKCCQPDTYDSVEECMRSGLCDCRQHLLYEAAAALQSRDEPVAWRLVGNDGKPIRWASIERGDLSSGGHPDDWSTAKGVKEAADELDKATAPHVWQPLYATPPRKP